MSNVNDMLYAAAVRDFRDARRRAAFQDAIARLTGRSDDLLPYEAVRDLIKAEGSTVRGLQEIPLDAIVGSVGRYGDFTRTFLPRRDSDEGRWAKIKLKTVYEGGLPPIEVYQLGEVYFVLDGNHRVSVARELGSKTIQAYVTEIPTKVPVTPDMDPDELIIQVRQGEFLARTELDRTRPDSDFSVTAPGSYRVLEEQIDLYRRRMGPRDADLVSWPEAAAAWHDDVYRPVAALIRQRRLLEDFPGRTEADLFVWICRHQERLQGDLGWAVNPGLVAEDLSTRHGVRRPRRLARLGGRLRSVLSPPELRSGPATGHWRREQGRGGRHDRLFVDLLLPVNGDELDWNALDQALLVAEREGARLHGLFTLSSDEDSDDETIERFRIRFEDSCRRAGVEATLAVGAGAVADTICRYARWTDLVVVSLSGTPEMTPVGRLGSDLRVVIRSCSRPVLALPAGPSAMAKALLAYDGSPKAKEALYVAAYLAGRWHLPLVVLTVPDDRLDAGQVRAQAFGYLQARGVLAEAAVETGAAGDAVLRAADEHGCDLILMGGYGFSPMLELVLGSAVDLVLRNGRMPVLICR